MKDRNSAAACWVAGLGVVIALFALLLSGTNGAEGGRGEVAGGEVPTSSRREREPSRAGLVDDFAGKTSLVSGGEAPRAEEDFHADGPEWEGQAFPPFFQVPGELGEVRVLACDEVLLDNGRSMRLIHIISEGTGESPVLLIEGGDGYGGVSKRGIFDPSAVRIQHGAEDNGLVYHRLAAIGLGDQAMSSTYDERISVQTPRNPLLILEFLSAIQRQLGDSGMAQLIPLRGGWGDLAPSHGDRIVRLQ